MNRQKFFKGINQVDDDKSRRMLLEAELVKRLLEYCSYDPGASIKIVVQHDNGHTATADLYDHAALVDSLYKTLNYFQDEMM